MPTYNGSCQEQLYLAQGKTADLSMRKQVIHFTIKASFHCLLALAFVRFYLNDQFKDFLEKRTTVTTKFEEAEALEFPTLTFCIHPGGKTSVAQKFGLTNFAETFLKETSTNLTLPQLFNELSYTLNQDFEIAVRTLYTKNTYLRPGLTSVPFRKTWLKFDTQPIITYFMGKCYKVQPLFDVRNSIDLHWEIALTVNNSIDMPRGIYLYFTSNETWNGIPLQRWPRYRPTKLYLSFKDDLHKILWRSVHQKFQSGAYNTSECLNENMENTTQYCQFLSEGFDLPICQKVKDLLKMFRMLMEKQWYSDCFKLVHATTYEIEHFKLQTYEEQEPDFLLFNLELNSMEQEIREEIPLITSQSLIGSIGGSLGMFFGFSISATFLYFFNKALQKYLN